ncbi:Hypothetical predicted protein [Pelobates cultripes]|uniref:Uncharacterized protein n=1 Tax=Pelobates cultripes TaxID=61616 RepID=A0AAD1QZZ8_PELCU|nr:Hypothetical predicted protein [Pelobates cultripes]
MVIQVIANRTPTGTKVTRSRPEAYKLELGCEGRSPGSPTGALPPPPPDRATTTAYRNTSTPVLPSIDLRAVYPKMADQHLSSARHDMDTEQRRSELGY